MKVEKILFDYNKVGKGAPFRKKLFAFTLLSLALFCAIGFLEASEQVVKIVITGTTDLHGHIYPIDYYTGREAPVGLAKIHTLVKDVRSKNPFTLLIDSGDLIQGTPLEYYHNKIDNEPIDPVIKVMNFMGYDAFAIGNHEFNFGLDVLNKAASEAKFPFLSANILKQGTRKLAYKPYLVKELSGIRIGILGLTTPGVIIWDSDKVKGILEFKDMVSEAKRWVPELKKKENVDLVVLAVHSGLGGKYGPTYAGYSSSTGVPPENAVAQIAEQVPGIDIIFAGHAHQEIGMEMINGVLVTSAKRWGERLSVAEIVLERKSEKWEVKSKKSYTLNTENVDPDPATLELVSDYHEATLNYVSTPIGTATGDFSGKLSRLKDTAIIDLIQKVQLDATGAELSIASSFNTRAILPKGEITIADVASIYIYDNTLKMIELTGKQIRDLLEFSARYFNIYDFGKSDTPLTNRDVTGYNFDMIQGVDCVIDITEPVGERITELTYKNNDVKDDDKFTVAINNYRQGGGGGYDMIDDAPIVYNKDEEVRQLMIDYITKVGTIDPEVDGNWQVIPDYITSDARGEIDYLYRNNLVPDDTVGLFKPYDKITFDTFIVMLRSAFPKKDKQIGTVLKTLNDAHTFHLNNDINREQAAYLVANTLVSDKSIESKSELAINRFSDKDMISEWAKPSLIYALDNGILTVPPDPDGRLNPKQEITREEAAQIIVHSLLDKFTVLSTNDFHGALVSKTVSGLDNRPIGGSAAIAGHVNHYRHLDSEGTLLLDAGDVMQGTPVSNLFEGKSTISIYNAMKYDAAAVGNHEFDWGVPILKERIKQAKFPFLNANIIDKSTNERIEWVRPYIIFPRKSANIGILGLITTQTPWTTMPGNVANYIFVEQDKVINEYVPIMKEKGADIIIVLTHSGAAYDEKRKQHYGETIDVARRIKSRVDLIVSGHLHTINHARIGQIPIIQAKSFGTNLGVSRIWWDPDLHKVVNVTMDVVRVYSDEVKDKNIERIVNNYDLELKQISGKVIAKTSHPIMKSGNDDGESALGNLIADAQRAAAGTDICLMNAGGIRTSLDKGTITWDDLFKVQPFQNTLVSMELTGAQIKNILEIGSIGNHHGIIQVSGMKFKYNDKKPKGSRVLEMTLDDGEPIKLDEVYTVSANNFMVTGGDGYTPFKDAKNQIYTGIVDLDALIEYVKDLPQPINYKAEGRIDKIE